ncbi:MAG: hypothetical protein MK334_05825 [SAR202 cluster bacterium]|nr:hypothetical protein [SAR202 cluster bacterium]
MARLLKNTSRTRKVRPYPLHPIQDCLEIATAIFSNNSGLPIDRNILASQLNSTPSSSGFITKLNSSFKYGLTNGGYKDPEISLTSLGQAVVSPKSENEFRLSLIQAALKPDLFRRFYEILDGKPVPPPENSKNLIYRDFNIDNSLLDECFNLIIENGRYTGIITQTGHQMLVNLVSYINSLNDSETTSTLQASISLENDLGTNSDLLSKNECLIGYVGMLDIANDLSKHFQRLEINSTVENMFFANNSELDKIFSDSIGDRKFAVLLIEPIEKNLDSSLANSQIEKISTILGALSVIFRNRLILVDNFGLSFESIPPGVEVFNFREDDSVDNLSLKILEIFIKNKVIEFRTK